MTKYFCRKCKTKLELIDEEISAFKDVMRCPKCGVEIIVDHREDLG